MPFVSVRVLKGVLNMEQKKEVARRIPQVIAEAKGVKAFAKNVSVVIEEVEDFWGVGGEIVTAEDVNKRLQAEKG